MNEVCFIFYERRGTRTYREKKKKQPKDFPARLNLQSDERFESNIRSDSAIKKRDLCEANDATLELHSVYGCCLTVMAAAAVER